MRRSGSRRPLTRRLAVALLGVATLAACKPEKETALPICLREVAGSEAEEVKTGEVPPTTWFAILLRNYSLKTSEVQKPVRDCSGREVAKVDEATSACLLGDEPPEPLPDRALTEEDLLVTPTEDGRLLVWIKTHHYENGEALGPLYLAEWTKRGVAVRAIGTLRAKTDRSAMRLEPMGEGRVLVVESQVCDPDNPKKCQRVMRLVPMQNDRFVELPLVLEDGTCIGPPEIALYNEHEVTLDGKVRKFELGRAVEFEEGNVSISEQVTIEDSDPEQPDAPPKVFRKANVQRPLTLSAKGLVTRESLWEKMVQEHGSVAVAAEPEADEDAETPKGGKAEGPGGAEEKK